MLEKLLNDKEKSNKKTKIIDKWHKRLKVLKEKDNLEINFKTLEACNLILKNYKKYEIYYLEFVSKTKEYILKNTNFFSKEKTLYKQLEFGIKEYSNLLNSRKKAKLDHWYIKYSNPKICTKKVLKNIAKKKPENLTELKKVKGVDYSILEKVGEVILNVLKHSKLTNIKLNEEEKKIYKKLKIYRKKQAKKIQRPLYCVFNNKTLKRIAKIKPKSFNELEKIKGIGDNRSVKYGEDIIAIIKNFKKVKKYKTNKCRKSNINSKNINLEFLKENPILKDKDFLFLDFETNGKKPQRITEIGAIKVKNAKVVKTINQLVKPKEKINYYVAKKIGITDKMVEKLLGIEDIFPQLLDLIEKDTIIVVHNSSFDIKQVLLPTLDRLDINLSNIEVIDTLEVSRKILNLDKNGLNNLSKYFNLDFNHHIGIEDAYVCLKIFEELDKRIMESSILEYKKIYNKK